MLPTLDDFLANRWPANAYIAYPGFRNLYVYKGVFGGGIPVWMNDKLYRCSNVLAIGAIAATRPGKGAFTSLVKDLVNRDLAVYVENAHNRRFADKLLTMGFIQVNQDRGPNFLYNFEQHLTEWNL